MDYISPIGRSWDEVRDKIFTPEEIVASRLRVANMIEISRARQAKKKSLRRSEKNRVLQ
jgi:hypothetical protein